MSKVRAEQYTNRLGTGAPEIPYGVTVPEGASIDGAGGLNLTGIATAGSFKGNLTGDVSGNVTGLAATFTGPVTIGGTLTYEDVTNIDSVGVITARDGVNVSSGDIDVTSGNVKVGTAITAYGSTGIISATSYRGDGSQLSGIEAAPTIQGVANGTIAADSSVIVQPDGKVANVTGYTAALGSSNAFYASEAHQFMSDFDSTTGKVIVVYSNNAGNNHMYAKVGTVSGTSVTYSTDFICSDSSDSSLTYNRGCSMACGNGKVVIVMSDSSTGGMIRVRAGTIDAAANSGAGSITYGTAVTVQGGNSNISTDICYDSDKDKFILLKSNDATGNAAESTIITLSGNTISTADDNRTISAGGDESNFLQIIYVPQKSAYFASYVSGKGENPTSGPSGSGYAKGLVGTINGAGNTMTWGTPSTMGTDNKNNTALCYVPSVDRVVIAYLDRYQAYRLESMVATVDWAAKTLAIGNYHVIESSGNSGYKPIIACLSDNEAKVVVAYMHSPGLVNNIGTVNSSNNSIAWAGRTTVDSSGTVEVGSAWGKPSFSKVGIGKFTMAGRDQSQGETWQIVRQFAATDITTENFIGFSKAAYTNGQTATVKVVGNVTTQSGLTPGKKYYVQNNGTLSSTAASPSVEAGRALTATSLLIKG